MADEITLANGQTLDQFVTEVTTEIASLQKEVAALEAPNAAVGSVVLGVFAAQGASSSTVNAVGNPVLSGSGGGGTESTPTANSENLTLSIQSGVFTFSNITPNNNTICIVSATNSKMQYPAWSIVQSNIKLAIDYAGYVHAMVEPGVGPITFTVQCVDSVGGSTAIQSFSVPVVQIGLQTPTRAVGAYVGLPTTGLVQNNTFLNSGVVGFNIANNTAFDLAAGYVRFVQPFAQGAVPSGSTLNLLEPATSTPIQTDVVNTYSDGSVKTAILTINQPAIASGTATQYLLGAVASGTATSIDLVTALNTAQYALEFNIQMLDLTGANVGSLLSFDLVAAMQHALASGTATYFQQGPLVTQARAVVLVAASLYLNVDISAFAGGSIRADIAVRNDIAMSAEGGPIYTTGTIVQNGATVYSWDQLYQTQYQAWFFECGTAPRYMASVQLDPAYLIKCAVIQPYNLTNGVNASTITGYESNTSSPNWLAPLNPNYVDVGMPGTGGRPDIGYETQSATVALITQDPRAIDYCCTQADASGSAPWNYYDMANKCWVNILNYPDIWLDQSNRGGVGVPGNAASTGPTQPVTTNPQGWALDPAHQPDLAFIPWIYTARRHYLDQVLAQGCWAVTGAYNRQQNIPNTSTLIPQCLWGGQVRNIAWNLRQVSNGLLCAPQNSTESQSFETVLEQNATYGAGLQTYLQSIQGSPYGYLAQSHGQNNFAPWEQNYLMPICALAGARGYTGWTPIANWFARFTVESFMPQNDGPYQGANWNQRNGSSYELFFGQPSTNGQSGIGIVGTPAQTWAALEYWTVVGGQSNGGETYDSTTNTVISGTPNWNYSNGDYGQLCLAVLNWAVLNNVPNATTALAWLESAGAPYTDQAVFQADPTFSLTG